MTDAKRDQNQIPVELGTSNADGSSTLPVQVNSSHAIEVEDGDSGSDLSGDNANRDNNRVTTIMGVSSDDGITPVPIYIDSLTGKLLIKST